jgi:hypothetical protein
MKEMNTQRLNNEPDEHYTRRIVNGVEIVEHETVRTIKMNGNRFETSKLRKPRLVISEAVKATKGFISKTRSDVAGLDKFLRTVSSRQGSNG